MSEVSEHYKPIAQSFTDHLARVSSNDWSARTPCEEWTVRDLVAHVIGTHRRILSTLDGSEPDDLDPNGELQGEWLITTDRMISGLGDEARATKLVTGMFGEMTFETVVDRLGCADTLVHTWDLARATHQDEHLDPDAVARAMGFLSTIDDAIRRPGGFAEKIEPSPRADDQTRFLNFCGRAV